MYDTLYVRLNRSYGYGDYVVYNTGPDSYNRLMVVTPDNEDPDTPYSISLWNVWSSEEFDDPFTEGSIIPVTLLNSPPLPSSFTVDFYDE